jgi:methylase of polypeptide subunit release factors
MTDRAAVARRFRDLAAAADGTDRPDWLASALGEATVRRRLDALADTVAAGPGETPADAYQSVLGERARTATGHFATDPAMATALARWAIRPRADGHLPRVLDPATGSGVFTTAALDRLAAVAPETVPSDRLASVVGVDVDPVALALTARRVLDRDATPSDPTLRLYESDFFDVAPSDARTVRVTEGRVQAGRFDAVVGNPPYVRQEAADTEQMRRHLAAFGPDGETPYLDGDRALSRRCDAYVYFLTHATRFLRDGGRLGLVVPAKWLTTRYGESVRRFLFNHYAVEAVVGFGKRAFDDALVDTVLLLATRRRRTADRCETAVQFCRLDAQRSVDDLLALLADGRSPAAPDAATAAGAADGAPGVSGGPAQAAASEDGDTALGGFAVDAGDGYRVAARRQGSLADADSGTLSPLLEAPAPFARLLAHPAFVPLGDLGRIERGVMTGANDFFFLDGAGRGADVEDRFRSPAIKSIRDVAEPVVTAAETDRSLLDVHEYVAAVLAESNPDDPAAAVDAALDRDGYDGLSAYLAWGREQGFHERRSCATRAVWFDLGDCRPPDVFVPKFFDERVLAVGNPDGLLASNAVDCLWAADGVDSRVLLGLLNATPTKGLLECWGRREGGGALQVMTYELATLPVPDPERFSAATREAIAAAASDLLAGDAAATRQLDRLVLDAIESPLSVEGCERLRAEMVRSRVRGGERAVRPLVDE